MKDYLTNILTRSFGVEPAIRPRVVSLYEPARVDMPVFESEVKAARPVREEVMHPRPAPEPLDLLRATLQTEEPARMPRLLHEDVAEDPARADRVHPRVDQPVVTIPTQRPVHPSLINDSDRVRPPAPTRIVVERTVERVIDRQQIPRHEQPSTDRPVAPVAQSDPASPSVTRKNVEPGVQLIQKPLVQSRPATETPTEKKQTADPNKRALLDLAPPSARLQPRVPAENAHVTNLFTKPSASKKEIEVRETRPVADVSSPEMMKPAEARVVHPVSVAPARNLPASEGGDTKPFAASEPTIQVTIGRVEVRAVSGEKPKSQRPRQTDLMSLDDYLRQRAQGS